MDIWKESETFTDFTRKTPEEYGERFVSNNVEVKVYTSSKKDNFQKGGAKIIYLSTKWLYRTCTTFEVELVFCYWADVNRLMYAVSLEGVVGDGGWTNHIYQVNKSK